MIGERDEEFAALYAFDLCDREDQTRLEAESARQPALRELMAELRDTSAVLVHLAPIIRPPATLKSRILDSVARDASAQAPPRRRAPVIIAFLPWAAAAGFAFAAAWFAHLFLTGQAASSLLRDRTAIDEIALQSSRQQLEAERIIARQQLATLESQLKAANAQLDLAHLKIVALASQRPDSPRALAVAVWDEVRQEGVLQVEKLPALLPSQDYQLWVVDPQYPNPVDGGVFTVAPASGQARMTFRAKQPVAHASAFAVTLERKGGVPKAEGPFVLLGK